MDPDPDPHGSAFIWLSWTRIRNGNADPDTDSEQENLPEFTNIPGFLWFKKAFVPSQVWFLTYYVL